MDVGAFVIGLSQISSFFSYRIILNLRRRRTGRRGCSIVVLESLLLFYCCIHKVNSIYISDEFLLQVCYRHRVVFNFGLWFMKVLLTSSNFASVSRVNFLISSKSCIKLLCSVCIAVKFPFIQSIGDFNSKRKFVWFCFNSAFAILHRDVSCLEN